MTQVNKANSVRDLYNLLYKGKRKYWATEVGRVKRLEGGKKQNLILSSVNFEIFNLILSRVNFEIFSLILSSANFKNVNIAILQ